MAHHVIYLSGVGDHRNSPLQIKVLKRWHKFGITPHFIKINWYSSESYNLKLKRILEFIDNINEGDTISLVGASAGASLAMNVYVARKNRISAVVLICGKINNPETLGARYRNQNPALLDSVIASSKNADELTQQDKQKMLTINPIFDEVIGKGDAVILGVQNKVLFSFSHAVSIFLSISVYKRIIINFIKSKRVQ